MLYCDYDLYSSEGGRLEKGEIDPFLKKASANIDILTFRRIKAIGFDKMSEWHKDIIKDASRQYAQWLHDNNELIEVYLKNYSINGASICMDGAWNMSMKMGVAIPTSIYTLLESTGLCNHSLHCTYG